MLPEKSTWRSVLYIKPPVIRKGLGERPRIAKRTRGGKIGKGGQFKPPSHAAHVRGRMLNGYNVRLPRHIIGRSRDRKHAGTGMLQMAVGASCLARCPRNPRRRAARKRTDNRQKFIICKKCRPSKHQERQDQNQFDLIHIPPKWSVNRQKFYFKTW